MAALVYFRAPCQHPKALVQRLGMHAGLARLLFEKTGPVDDASKTSRENAQCHAHAGKQEHRRYRRLNEMNDIHLGGHAQWVIAYITTLTPSRSARFALSAG